MILFVPQKWLSIYSIPKIFLASYEAACGRGGVLGVMTKLVLGKVEFSQGHYKNDSIHVCVYSKPTFNFLAEKLDARLEFIDNDVILLSK